MPRTLVRRSLIALAVALPAALAADEPSSAIPRGVGAASLGKFQVTYYWVTCEEDAKGERDTELLDPRGRSLGKFRAGFVKHLKIEGTGRTLEGRTLNTAGKGAFAYVKHPWGTGAKGVGLTPFRSIAVDPKTIALGTKVFIPEAVGAPLPDGSTHDGVFVAEDTGGAIKGKHIDVFSGLARDMKVLASRRIDGKNVELHELKSDERKPSPPPALRRAGVVRFAQVAARERADAEAQATGTLREGDKVTVIAREGGWLKLKGEKWVEALTIDMRAP